MRALIGYILPVTTAGTAASMGVSSGAALPGGAIADEVLSGGPLAAAIGAHFLVGEDVGQVVRVGVLAGDLGGG